MATRLKDIAQALNISISTVSYALNDGPRAVPEKVREQVLRTAREMGYRPNRLARSLAAGRTMTLGVVPVVMGADFIANPYFQGCFGGVVTAAKEQDWDVLLYTHAAFDTPRLADVILDGRADGLIFLAPFKELAVLERVAEANIPFSIISGMFHGSVPSFRCDNAGGIRRAVEHLASLGHTRIAHFCGDLSMFDGADRLEGFTSAAAALGLPVRDEWITCGAFSTDRGYETALQLLSKPDRPTAIVCASDEIATGVYRAASALGIQIPFDLSVTGFDDSNAALLLSPQLTTIHQPFGALGEAATRAVIELIDGRTASNQLFVTDLVIRQSTTGPKEAIL